MHMGWQMVSFFMYLYCLLDAVMQEQVITSHPLTNSSNPSSALLKVITHLPPNKMPSFR